MQRARTRPDTVNMSPTQASSLPDPARAGQSTFLETSFSGGVLTVRMAGPNLGQRETPIVAGELHRTLEQYRSRLHLVVLDMSDVKTMASLGLGLCIDARNTTNEFGARTVLYGLNEQLQELFTMMKVDRLFTMASTKAELHRTMAA